MRKANSYTFLFSLCLLLTICISCGSSNTSSQQSALPSASNSTVNTSPIIKDESIFYNENSNPLTKGDNLVLRCTFNLDFITLANNKPSYKTSANVFYFLNDTKVADAENGKQVMVETTNIKAGSYQVSANLMLNQVTSANQMLGNIVIQEDLWDNPSGQEWYFEIFHSNKQFKYYKWLSITGNGQMLELEVNQGYYSDPVTKNFELANFTEASGDNLRSIIKNKGRVVGYSGSKNMKKYTDLISYINDKNFKNDYYHPKVYYIMEPRVKTVSVLKYDKLSHRHTSHTLSNQHYTYGINLSTEAGLINNWLDGHLDGHSLNLEDDINQLNLHKAKWESYQGPYSISYSGANIEGIGTTSWKIIRPSSSSNQLIRDGYGYLSVDAMFTKLQSCLRDWGPQYKVSYSEDYGYPIIIKNGSSIDNHDEYNIYSNEPRIIEVIKIESFSTIVIQ